MTCTGFYFDINIQLLIIEGTFTVISTGNVGFAFGVSINILVRSGGTFRDQTDNFQLCFQEDSIVTILPGGGFVGSNTQVYTCASSSGGVGSGSFVTFPSITLGPFTYGLLPNGGGGSTFSSIMCFVRRTGNFTSGATWLGLIAPTIDFCTSVGGCDLSIPPGFTLDTVDLNGVLNIPFNVITVSPSAIFQLGTPGLPGSGFLFNFEFTFNVYGSISYVAIDDSGMCILFGTDFNFFSGASISSTIPFPLVLVDPATGALTNSSVVLSSSTPSGLFVEVSTSGTLQQNTAATFTAARNGLFSSPSTWAGGVPPSGTCSIRIPANIVVTIVESTFLVNIQVLTIRGTLILSATGGFTFNSSINVMINRGGILRDQTNAGIIYVRADSIFTWLPGSSFVGAANSQMCSFIGPFFTDPPLDVAQIGAGISGPFTAGVLLDNTIQTFGSVMCLVRQSGGFTASVSWLGLVAPTSSFCASVGGCDLSIPTGLTLDTDDLNGGLNIPFNVIFVANGATFNLGSAGLSGGFRFYFEFSFIIYGTLSYLPTDTTGILFPFGTMFNCFGGARISASSSVLLSLFDPLTNVISSTTFTLPTGLPPPLFFTVSSTGTVEETTGGTFIAAYTGAFFATRTWIGGVLPSGNCTIRIPPNIAVTYTGAVLNVSVLQLNILGTFIVSSTGSLGFTFSSITNIFVGSGGTFQDQTDNNVINFQRDSILTFATGSFFIGSNTRVFSLGSSTNANFTIGSSLSSALTVGFLVDGSILTFSSVMCIPRASGDFTRSSTWLGRVAPDVTFCSSVGGCDLYATPSFILSTASLNGSLNILFNVITVPEGGRLQIGTLGITAGFRFRLPVTLAIYGTLENIVTGSSGIFIPFGSQFNFYATASFVTPLLTALRIFNPNTSATLGSGFILDNDLRGPFFIEVSTSGIISVDGGAITTTAATATSTAITQVVTYSAIQSGDFNDPDTWSTGSVPSDNSIVIIPLGATVTFTGSTFDMYLRSILVYGTLSISASDSLGFTFSYPVNILVGSLGTFDFQSSTGRINVVVGSVLSFASGSTYSGTNAAVYAYSSDIDQATIVSDISLSSTMQRPFTHDITANLSARSFPRITFIVRQSGSFLNAAVWPGFYRPSNTFCTSAQGCGLYIASGFNLTTADLNGTLNINFVRITVESNGVFQLGTSSLSIGFRFRLGMRLDAFGAIQYVAPAGTNLLVQSPSSINIFTGASFSSSGQITLASYAGVNTTNILGTATWVPPLSGPIFYNIDSAGSITNTTTSPEISSR